MRLRFLHKSTITGTTFDYFVPPYDMPSYPQGIQYIDESDIKRSKFGNVYRYSRPVNVVWTMRFDMVSYQTATALSVIASSWNELNPITIIYYGSLVNSGSSYSWLATAGQLWGTTIAVIKSGIEEVDFNLYSCTIEFHRFGKYQT